MRCTAVALLIGMWMAVSMADEVATEATAGLDQQIQDAKKEVLRISAELTQLQEKLLYPSSTEVSLFLSLAQGDKLRLGAVTLKIDGNNITQYIYTPRELEALQYGGVQHIYAGNIRGGTHTLDVEISGQSADNKDFQQSNSHKFYKMKGPKVIEIILSGAGSRIQSIAD